MAVKKLKDKVLEYLRENPGRKFAARDIATIIAARYPEEYNKKMESSDVTKNHEQLIQVLASEINTALVPVLEKNSQLKMSKVPPPQKYYWMKKD